MISFRAVDKFQVHVSGISFRYRYKVHDKIQGS